MKKISFILGFIFMGGITMAQSQTIQIPDATPTIKNNEIISWGQNSTQNGSRSIVYLDFEGLGDGDSVLNFYNGGTSKQGFSGTNYGVHFTANALSLIDVDAGGTGNFANEPSPNTVLFFLAGTADTMNIPGGFVGILSFYYTASGNGSSVTVFSGINGTGSVLANLVLPINYTDGNCSGDPSGTFCNWDLVNMPFPGTAKSVTFAGVANQCGFDDISFTQALPSTPISNWALMLSAVLIAAFIGIKVIFLKRV